MDEIVPTPLEMIGFFVVSVMMILTAYFALQCIGYLIKKAFNLIKK